MRHLQKDHRDCSVVDMHAKTKSVPSLDSKNNSFTRLLMCLNRIKGEAAQLCRFRSVIHLLKFLKKSFFDLRNTGLLESYNGLTLKYCSKRIGLPYDLMTMRKDLAALDHNHHVLRSYKKKGDGQICAHNVWKKSTKAYSLRFEKVILRGGQKI